MAALLRVFLDIALLKSGPQVLPASGLLLALAAAACFVSTLAVLSLLIADGGALLRAAGAELLLDAFGIGLVLAAARRTARYPQTLSAVYGSGVVLNLALLPIVALHAYDPARFGQASALLQLLVLGWGLAVLAHILRHALELVLGLALGLAAFYLFLAILARRALGLG